MATQQKNLDAFELVLSEDLPVGMSVEASRWRRCVDALGSTWPTNKWRIYLMEAASAHKTDPVFRCLAQMGVDTLKEKVSVKTFLAQARQTWPGR